MSLFDEWWDATRDQRLVIQRCGACGGFQHYPRPLCLACGATDLSFVAAAGGGVVHSFTVIHRPPRPDLDAPYVVAIVQLDEGPRMLSHVVGCDPGAVRCEQRVLVRWEPMDDGRHRPVFAPEG